MYFSFFLEENDAKYLFQKKTLKRCKSPFFPYHNTVSLKALQAGSIIFSVPFLFSFSKNKKMTNKTTSKRAAETQPESSESKRHKLDKNEKRIYFIFIFFSKKKILYC